MQATAGGTERTGKSEVKSPFGVYFGFAATELTCFFPFNYKKALTGLYIVAADYREF